jgi:hypothetical protein
MVRIVFVILFRTFRFFPRSLFIPTISVGRAPIDRFPSLKKKAREICRIALSKKSPSFPLFAKGDVNPPLFGKEAGDFVPRISESPPSLVLSS